MTDSPMPHASAAGSSVRGGVDLTALLQKHAAEGSATAPAASGSPALEVVEVTELGFPAFAERSLTVPAFLLLCSRLAPACAELRKRLEAIAAGYAGRLVLGFADVDAEPGIAAAFQVTAVPAMVALIGGRPAPLFQGSPEDEQLRSVIEQVLQISAEAGIGAPMDPSAAPAAAPEPPPLPPLHQEAYDAIERGDYTAAIAAYDRALKENPKDADAKAGRAQVSLMQRAEAADPATARAAALHDATDVSALLAVADADLMDGDIEAALASLLAAVRSFSGDDRELIRVRLLEYFEVVGLSDPRVVATRQALASALY